MVNYVDAKGQKKGHWIIKGDMAHEPGYSDQDKVEEGEFIDNKREGVWIEYYPGGAIRGNKVYKNASIVSDTVYAKKKK